MTDKDTFYVTTPIYYPNDVPHIGHCYTTVAADILTRWNKLLNKRSFFLTGTDEHGQKIEQAAIKNNKDPKQFTDELVERFKETWKLLNCDYNKFIRTTDQEHKDFVIDIINKVNDKGDIYLGEYQGYYCTPCETFLTQMQAKDKLCPECNREVQLVKEESYFFRLSQYQDKLLKYYEENPDFISPITRKNEVINRVKQGLKDLSITRTSFNWGIEFPLDKNHVTYVWFDALTNYMSAIKKDNFKFWPCDVHLVGKDIVWFHTVIWPAMLMSAGYQLPKKVFAHGFWTSNGEKMSKSKNNFIVPKDVIDKYGVDAFRYFMFREITFGSDGDFSDESIINRYNNELGNELGNLLMRAVVLVEKHFDGKIPKAFTLSKAENDLLSEFDLLKSILIEDFEKLEFNIILDKIWKLIRDTNKYMNDTAPWKLIKQEDGKDKTATVLNTTCNMLNQIAHLLYSFIPKTCEKIAESLSFNITTLNEIQKDLQDNQVKKLDALFPRIENKTKDNNQNQEFEEIKLDLRVAKIIEIKEHPDADKLFVEKLDLGDGKTCQILSGLKPYYKTEKLLNKNIILLCNLEPAKIRGELSEGMLLAAESDNVVGVLIAPDANPGDKIQIEGQKIKDQDIINYKQFSKYKLESREDGIYINNKKLTINNQNISVDKNIVGKIR